MAKTRILEKLKSGQSHTGKVIDVSDDYETITFEGRDEETKFQLPVPEKVGRVIENDYDEEIITVTNDGGAYDIEEHEDWPDEKEKSKK
jgi:hypothetical protein